MSARRIFIGDLQGCCAPLEKLLEHLAFDPDADRLYFAGDLVNRGGESLQTLRLVHSLRHSVVSVLGNHDLHLLAYAFGQRRKPNREFDAILDDASSSQMLDWLRACPLLWLDEGERLALVHAGVDPRWDARQARASAREVERALAEQPERFFAAMYGDEPDRWQPDLPEADRLRTITNVMTRMRLCRADGRLDLAAKGGPGQAMSGYAPWYQHLHDDWNDWTVVFGHWSQLGLYQDERVVCLDSGCVWGGELSALVVEEDSRRIESVDCAGRTS